MKSPCSTIIVIMLLSVKPVLAQITTPSADSTYQGSIEVLDDELQSILNVSSRPEVLAEGFRFTEGPVWVSEGGFLLFSDIPANAIYRWSAGSGISVYLKPAGHTQPDSENSGLGPNGLIINQEGYLVIAQHGDRRIARMNAPITQPSPKFTSVADQYRNKKFNSPNDVIQHNNGSYYFTDPPYGLPDDTARELPFQGLYRAEMNGKTTLVADSLTRPNGLAFSPDRSLLYVGNSDTQHAYWAVYEVDTDGNVTKGRVFYDITHLVGTAPGLPDGMKVNRAGYLFATGPGGIWIFSPDGRALGTIKTGAFTSNCAFDENEDFLYITASSSILRLKLR